MEQRKSLVRNQEGFTLIEIIAVLVLLGILAAVAVPRYFDMQADARNKAVNGALAEGVAQANQAYAQQILSLGGLPTRDQVMTKIGSPVVSGDFTITFTTDGTVDATSKKGKIKVSATYTTIPTGATITPAEKSIEFEFSG